jgi:hypothetical protein
MSGEEEIGCGEPPTLSGRMLIGFLSRIANISGRPMNSDVLLQNATLI